MSPFASPVLSKWNIFLALHKHNMLLYCLHKIPVLTHDQLEPWCVLQRADAQQEVLSRLSPELQSYFLKRAASKQRNSSQAADRSAVSNAPSTLQSPQPAASGSQAVHAPRSGAGSSGSAKESGLQASSANQPAAPNSTGRLQNARVSAADMSSLASRLRFSLAGQVVEVQPLASQAAASKQVVQRDILRCCLLLSCRPQHCA